MPKPKKVVKKPIGRPTLFKEEYCEQVEKLCKLGAKDTEIAEFLGIQESTLNLWKQAHPEFMESLKRGKVFADANVAERLYQRAMGYSHSAVKIFNNEGMITEAPYVEHYPPDTTAAIFWLKNRQPKMWRDKVETEHSGEMGITWKEEKTYAPEHKADQGA